MNPLRYLFDEFAERLVQKFGTSLTETEKIRLHFREIRRVPKSSTGTLLPIPNVTVTIVSDTEIETIDSVFQNQAR